MPRKTKTKTTTKARRSSKKAVATKRPKFKKVKAISIRLPHEIVEDGEKPTFYINYVLTTGELVTRECTHKVWKDMNSEELYRKFRYEFEIFEDSGTGEVQHINASVKKEHLPAGFSEEDIVDEVSPEPRFVEVSVSPDNVIKVTRAPSSCTKATEDEIIDSLASDLEVQSGDYLKGSYRIEEIREREGFKTIFVDAKFNQ